MEALLKDLLNIYRQITGEEFDTSVHHEPRAPERPLDVLVAKIRLAELNCYKLSLTRISSAHTQDDTLQFLPEHSKLQKLIDWCDEEIARWQPISKLTPDHDWRKVESAIRWNQIGLTSQRVCSLESLA